MRRSDIIAIVIVAAMLGGQIASAQDKPGTTRFYTSGQLAFTQSIAVTQITISADGTIVVHKALDPQTVLCIEKPDPPSYTISGGNYLLWGGQTYPTKTEESKPVGVEKKPPIPARVCRTIEAWLEDRR